MNSPILLIIFNRPETTRQVLEVIRQVKPSKLYIAADGPRENIKDDFLMCQEARNLVTLIDWKCEVITLFSDVNLGCKKGVVSAIDWFFTNENEGIILEDDIIPTVDFFGFCDNLLNKYRLEPRIGAITGFNNHGQDVNSDSYFFYQGFYPWGWATWKRFWQGYKQDITDFSSLELASKKTPSNLDLHKSIKFNLNLINHGLLDTWDYQFLHLLAITDSLVVAPYANLVRNIGINGAHSTNNKNRLKLSYGGFDIKNLIHPKIIEVEDCVNKIMLMEYKKVKSIIVIKEILILIGIYKFTRTCYKFFKLHL